MSQQGRFDFPPNPAAESAGGVVIDLQRATRRSQPLRRHGLVIGSHNGRHQHWSVQEDVPERRVVPDPGERQWPDERSLVVLAMPAGRAFVQEAVRAGAAFYVLRDAGEMAALLAGGGVAPAPRPAPPADPLTRRQRDVLRQVALGRATKEIAFRLCLSPKTVAAHRAHIMERLGLRDVAALVIYALRRGIVGIEDYDEPVPPAPVMPRRRTR